MPLLEQLGYRKPVKAQETSVELGIDHLPAAGLVFRSEAFRP